MRKLSTGEPCAGELHARFGGRGELRKKKKALLYPYKLQGRTQITIPGTGYPLPGEYDGYLNACV